MMTPVQWVGFAVFVTTVGWIFGTALVGLVRATLERRGRSARPSPRRLLVRRTVRVLAGIGVLCFLYGRFVEPDWPETTHVRIASSKWPAGTSPLRIVHLSDIHSDATERLEPRLPSLVAAEKPDLIVFTGDAANSPEGVETFRRCFAKIAAVAPTYAVRGNWDVTDWHTSSPFRGTGATELVGRAVLLEVRGTPVYLAGLAFGRGSPGAVLSRIPKEALTIFLYHTPDLVEEVADDGADVYCAGHTHGGQIALPFYGAILTLSRYGKRFESGLYRVRNTSLYVTRGIGMEGGSAPRVRFFARPEITVIEVVPSSP